MNPPKPLSIAVTGNAASGKSTVCSHLKALGHKVISADEIAREAVAPGSEGLKKVTKRFGTEILDAKGTIDRQKLRRIITRDNKAQNDLEKIIHPEVLKKIFMTVQTFKEKESKKKTPGIIFTEIPLLFELNLENRFDRHILVVTSRNILLKRLASRDNVTLAEAGKLLDIQMPAREKIRRADIIIPNDTTRENLLMETEKAIAEITKSSKRT